MRTGKYLFIQAPQRELYNQSSDPGELHNLAESSKAVTDTLATQLADFRSKTSQTLVDLAKPDPEKMQKLQALGYVGSDTTPAQDEKALTGTDPKTQIEIANCCTTPCSTWKTRATSRRSPLLERALVALPNMPVANMQYGIAQARLKHFDKAIPPLQKAVTLQPDNGMGHYELGLALFETGDWKGAAPEFEAAAGRAPRWADAHFSLAAVYARIDRVPDAMTELDTTLGISADHYRANLLRGRILSLQGNPLGALNNLEKAARGSARFARSSSLSGRCLPATGSHAGRGAGAGHGRYAGGSRSAAERSVCRRSVEQKATQHDDHEISLERVTRLGIFQTPEKE